MSKEEQAAAPRGRRGSERNKSTAKDKATGNGQDDPPHLCGTCKNPVSDNDQGLLCDVCNIWFHSKCQGVSDNKYAAVKEDRDEDVPLLHWYCNTGCNKIASSFLEGLWNLEKKVNKMSTVITSVSTKVNSVSDKVNKLEQGDFPQVMQDAVKKISENACLNLAPANQGEATETKTNCQMEEMEDRMRRRKNVLIFKVPESKAEDASVRKEEDKGKITALFGETKTKHRPIDISEDWAIVSPIQQIRPQKTSRDPYE